MTQSVSVYFVLFLALVLIQVCVHPPPSAVNVALPAFAAERRAEAPLLLSASACCTAPAAIDRYLRHDGRSAANPPHAAAVVDLSSTGQTDRRTGGRSTVT